MQWPQPALWHRVLLKVQDLTLKPFCNHDSRRKKPNNKILNTDYNNLNLFFIDLDLAITFTSVTMYCEVWLCSNVAPNKLKLSWNSQFTCYTQQTWHVLKPETPKRNRRNETTGTTGTAGTTEMKPPKPPEPPKRNLTPEIQLKESHIVPKFILPP